jgi:thiamine-monophosphate kinase
MKEKKVSAIGERALISLLSEIFKVPAKKGNESPGKLLLPGELLVGPGSDDCAVFALGGEDCLVVTTDMLHRTTDFPEGMTPWQIGWMSAAVNLSDIAAMGARPIGLLMAIGMPAETEISFTRELAKGIKACAEFCETPVAGGDLDTHRELTITGTALGLAKKSQLLHRSGARPGDLVCITGRTGSAGAALELHCGFQSKQRGTALKRKNRTNKRNYENNKNNENKEKTNETLIKSLFEPVPRIHEAQRLAASGAVTSMIDTSDGLAMSLHDLAKAGKTGFKLLESSFPILQEVRNFALTAENPSEKLLEFALYTGGDFELLFTISPGKLNKVQNICNFTVIGVCTEYREGILLEHPDGRIDSIEPKGYQQLKTEND